MYNLAKAVADIREAKEIHQWFADNPKHCGTRVGNVKWHKKWVKAYDNILGILAALDRPPRGVV